MEHRTAPAINQIESILSPSCQLRMVDGPPEQGIWSVLERDPGTQQYDSIGATYDRIVGNGVYQRIVWGNKIARDAEFARAAAGSAEGWLLDAGCGSLVFTAPAHAASGRPTVLFDLSIGMLARARTRLVALCGRVPEHVILVQGDVFALPFRADCFETILCPGIIHLFEKPAVLLESLAGPLAEGGGLYLSSLVTDRSFGARMLRLMERRGEVPNPMNSDRLAEIVADVFGRKPKIDTMGNMAHVRFDGVAR